LIVIVFDPLAVALIITFNGLIAKKEEKKNNFQQELEDFVEGYDDKTYEVYGDNKPTFDMGKLDDLFEENYKKEEEIVENKSEETDLTQPLQWEDYMHPEFPWHNRTKWINNPKAVNFWMSAKGGTAKELNKLRKEEENTKTY